MEINIWGTDFIEPPDLPLQAQIIPAEKESDCPEDEQSSRKTLLGLIIPLFLRPEAKAASDCD